jgi:hypothetical protein
MFSFICFLLLFLLGITILHLPNINTIHCSVQIRVKNLIFREAVKLVNVSPENHLKIKFPGLRSPFLRELPARLSQQEGVEYFVWESMPMLSHACKECTGGRIF